MSDSQHHGPNWFVLFVVAIGAFDMFLLFMLSQCKFSALDAESFINSALCVVYGIFSIICFALGVFISLIGVEHAKRNKKNPQFFYFSAIYFVAGIVVLLLYKLS